MSTHVTNQLSKLQALKTLIDHSFLLSAQDKDQLYLKLETMTPEEVDALGTLLALEKQTALQSHNELIKKIRTYATSVGPE